MLSVVIPTLNEEKYLPGLLKSIKAQTFKDYEIIVADAGSKDKTVEIAKNYGCIVVKGGLPAKGRNEGARVAQGDQILFLDADTKLPTKDFFKKVLKEFRDRNLDVASCQLLPLEKSKILSSKIVKALFGIANRLMILFEKIPSGVFGVGSMVLVKKAFHKKIKGFNENIRFGEDTHYFRRAAKVGKFGILKSVKIHWSIRRWEKEKWLRVIFLSIMNWFLIGINEKALEIFKKGPLEYRFDYYKEPEMPRKKHLQLEKKIKKFLKEIEKKLKKMV